ncbi:MAG: TolC family protein [Desulfobacterales bacterium]|nr:TolC family protein [Desulfobacterales bacterium]
MSIPLAAAGRERVTAMERAFLPRVEWFAAGGLYGAQNPETGAGQIDDTPWKNDVSGGIRISMPLLDGGLRRSGLAQSRAEFEKARVALRAARLAAKRELTVARANVQSARAKIRIIRKTAVHAEKVLRIEQLKYRVGRGTSAEVLDAEAALLHVNSLSGQAVRELEVALLAQRLALGTLD